MDHGEEAIKKKAAKLLKVDESAIGEIRIVHRSIDARKKPQLLFSYIVDVMLANSKREGTVIKKAANQNIRAEGFRPYAYPEHGTAEMKKRPVIIGAGPAGMFAALALSENGCAPILLEQGDAVEERTKRVEDFWKNGDEALDIRSNVQFGEGGAGTFSDGKLNTLVKDTSGRNGKVLSTFVEMGADPSILYDHAPHIGTDVLRGVVKNIRNRIIAGGGEVHFRTEVTKILEENGRVTGVMTADGAVIETDHVILSVGHSARDLFAELDRMKVFMEPKPFAVGLRIQHPQAQINKNQYGMEDAGKLGAAPYKVTAKTTSGRGVYQVGPVVGRQMLMLGKRLTAQEAQAANLIDEVVEKEQVESWMANQLAQLEKCGPVALAHIKQLILALENKHADYPHQLLAGLMSATQDCQQATRAFAEKSSVSFHNQ